MSTKKNATLPQTGTNANSPPPFRFESATLPPTPPRKCKVGIFGQISRGTLHRLEETWKCITCHLVTPYAVSHYIPLSKYPWATDPSYFSTPTDNQQLKCKSFRYSMFLPYFIQVQKSVQMWQLNFDISVFKQGKIQQWNTKYLQYLKFTLFSRAVVNSWAI